MQFLTVNWQNLWTKYIAEQTCLSGINNPTIQQLSMSTVESRVTYIKTKVHKVSSNLKSGGAPVWHRFPVKPELQLHIKPPAVFTHEPPFWQTGEFPDIDAHSSMSKTHMHIIVLFYGRNSPVVRKNWAAASTIKSRNSQNYLKISMRMNVNL